MSSSKKASVQTISLTVIENFFDALAANGIDMNGVCDELMNEGLSSFKEAFIEILNALE